MCISSSNKTVAFALIFHSIDTSPTLITLWKRAGRYGGSVCPTHLLNVSMPHLPKVCTHIHTGVSVAMNFHINFLMESFSAIIANERSTIVKCSRETYECKRLIYSNYYYL